MACSYHDGNVMLIAPPDPRHYDTNDDEYINTPIV